MGGPPGLCVAHGTPTNGWLEKPYNMIDTAIGYYHYLPEDNCDDWGTLELINMIEGAGRDWDAEYNDGSSIGVGDLSYGDLEYLYFGGPFEPHGSHQNGLDVDMRYMRTDGARSGINIALCPDDYDNGKTQDLIDYLEANANINVIYVDMDHAFLSGRYLEHMSGHSDHIHVRIVDPDGTGNKTERKTTRGYEDENQINR